MDGAFDRLIEAKENIALSQIDDKDSLLATVSNFMHDLFLKLERTIVQSGDPMLSQAVYKMLMALTHQMSV